MSVPRAPSLARRSLELAEWLVPGVLMAVMPKCPMCFAAYVGLWTGVGFSVTTATYVRLVLIVLCTASLSFLAVTRMRRIVRARRG